MSAGDTQLLADAFQALNNTLKSIHAVFFRMAILCIVLWMLGLATATIVLNWSNQRFEYRLNSRIEAIPSDVVRAINIQMTQSVKVDETSKSDAIMKIIADKRKLKEQNDAGLRTD